MDPETIDPLLSALPPSWLATIEAYAPHVLAWLLALTALVHVLVPVARAVERWAIASSVTWDDEPARRFAELVEWAASATTAVLAYLPRLAVGGMRRDAAGVAPQRARTMRPPPSEAGLALALVIVAAAALSALTSGCSGGAYRGHAAAITATSGGLSIAGAVADTARDAALDAVEEAHPAHGPERTAALEAEAARWRPVGVALDAGRAALLAWVQSVEMARLAGTPDADLLRLLAPVAARVVLLYDQIAALLTALDVDGVPALPAMVRSLATAIGGE